MEYIDTFEEFVAKKDQEKDDNKVDWDKRKSEWMESIDLLYKDIKKWLQPVIDKKLVVLSDEKTVDIIEDHLGHYKEKRLDIFIGNDKLSLVPKGTLIFGAYGRIDFEGTRKIVMLVEPQWGEWEIAERTPGVENKKLTEDSFKQIIQDLI